MVATPARPTTTTRSTRRSARVGVTEAGIEKVEDYLGIDNLYESVNTPLSASSTTRSRRKELFKRDKDYVVMDGEVMIVDEFTGRILHGRRYNEGMHQAIEAKEGVEIKAENQTLATITLQNYFRMYDKLAGMTGTAETEAAEFMPDLQARRRADPDQPPMIRDDQADLVYKTEEANSTQSSTTSPNATRRASRSSSAPPASRRASTSRGCC